MTPLDQTHIMFDLDGTLVDTRSAVTECYTIVFREKLGSDFPPENFPVSELFAMRPAEVFAFVAPDRVDELHTAYRDTYPRCTPKIKVFGGIRELILGLKDEGRKLSVVTNKGLERTLIDLDVAGIPPDTFETIVTAEDTVERKPDPAPIMLGMQRVGAVAADVVYVGDGPQDVLAARAAGMKAIAVTYGFYSRETLVARAPDVLVDSVTGLALALGLHAPGRTAR